MKSNEAIVYINKLGAAHRQLQEAIRMTFAAVEPLAIHTVAAAAYGILKDLTTERFATLLKSGILAIAKDYASGEIAVLPGHLRQNPEMAKLIVRLADTIRRNGVVVADENFSVEASPDIEQQFWNHRNFAANYLKHANYDPSGVLDVQRLDTGTLIMMAIGAYPNLFPQITPEMEVFHVFNAAEAGIRDGIRERYRDILDMLEKLDTDGRRAVCQEWLSKLKSKHDNGGAGCLPGERNLVPSYLEPRLLRNHAAALRTCAAICLPYFCSATARSYCA